MSAEKHKKEERHENRPPVEIDDESYTNYSLIGKVRLAIAKRTNARAAEVLKSSACLGQPIGKGLHLQARPWPRATAW